MREKKEPQTEGIFRKLMRSSKALIKSQIIITKSLKYDGLRVHYHKPEKRKIRIGTR